MTQAFQDVDKGEKFENQIKKIVQNIDWESLPDDNFSVHDFVQCEIVNHCNYGKVTAVPEFAVEADYGNGAKKRIDVAIYVDGQLESAIEVDGTVKTSSVKKLKQLPERVEKIIVSKSKNKSKIYRRCDEHLIDSFNHIDVKLYDKIE